MSYTIIFESHAPKRGLTFKWENKFSLPNETRPVVGNEKWVVINFFDRFAWRIGWVTA